MRLILLACCLLGLATPAGAAGVWKPVAEKVVDHLEAAVADYRNGKAEEAKRQIITAYFGVFETEKLEAAMRIRLGTKTTYEVERQFGELRKAIQNQVSPETLAEQTAALAGELRRYADELEAAGVPAEIFNTGGNPTAGSR